MATCPARTAPGSSDPAVAAGRAGNRARGRFRARRGADHDAGTAVSDANRKVVLAGKRSCLGCPTGRRRSIGQLMPNGQACATDASASSRRR
jgi:hypothetical protein